MILMYIIIKLQSQPRIQFSFTYAVSLRKPVTGMENSFFCLVEIRILSPTSGGYYHNARKMQITSINYLRSQDQMMLLFSVTGIN